MNIEYITDVDCVVDDWIGGFSKFEREIIMIWSIPKILHLFSGNSDIGDIRIDLSPKSRVTLISDVFEYIQQDHKEHFNTILLDPVYCNEERKELWRKNYSKDVDEKLIYVYPYDSRKTKQLFEFFKKVNPKRIILKSMSIHNIEGFEIEKAYILEIGAYKPNRIMTIYRSLSNGVQSKLF